MTNILIIILLIILIFKDGFKKKKENIKKEDVDKQVDIKEKALREEFENIMSYSIEDAIKSKNEVR